MLSANSYLVTRHSSLLPFWPEVQIPHQPVEVVRVDAEGACGFGDASRGVFERARDELALGLADGLVIFRDGRGVGARGGLGFEHGLGGVFGEDRGGLAEDDGALDRVLKLADVPRPVVVNEALARLIRDARNLSLELRAVLRREVRRE